MQPGITRESWTSNFTKSKGNQVSETHPNDAWWNKHWVQLAQAYALMTKIPESRMLGERKEKWLN